jgi:hypothetical protein
MEEDKEWQKIMKTLGTLGIWYYVKKSYYPKAIEYLERNGFHHDLNKTQGKIAEIQFRDFEYKAEIARCDFSNEYFSDSDIIIQIWKVDNKDRK